MTYYVSPLNQFTKDYPSQTVDAALSFAERASLIPLPGTEGIFDLYMVWEETFRPSIPRVRAIARRGKARWVQECDECGARESVTYCRPCNTTGYIEEGTDRG